MISIVIPTFNNLEYLKCTIDSIKKNSTSSKFEILLHINDGSDGTLSFAKNNNFSFTHSEKNVGLCTSINEVCKITNYDYLLYSHDDMYFCPNWDDILASEIKSLNNNLFYLSATMIEVNSAHISFDCGSNLSNFNEEKLLNNYKKLTFYDHQGSHFAPHLVHKKIWEKVGGFSEEFNPGMGSDPDFNMKLWNEGVRIFKGIEHFKVYHFSSITTRKKNGVIKNNGDITFLKKWGFSIKFFKKYFLKSKTIFLGPLTNPKKNILFYFDLFLCKIRMLYLYIFNK
jgi:glycosyltransferase involved in cell wall biosynthesis